MPCEMDSFGSDWFSLVNCCESIRQLFVFLGFIRESVWSSDSTFERIVEGCRLSGAKSSIAYPRDAREGSFGSDVFVEDFHEVYRCCSHEGIDYRDSSRSEVADVAGDDGQAVF